MKKSLFTVSIGLHEDGQQIFNFGKENVIALDALAAIKKVRLKKNEFIESVVRIDIIHKP